MLSGSAQLAEVEQHVLQAAIAKKCRDPVGNEALSDAGQGHAHAAAAEADGLAGQLDRAVVDETARRLDPGRWGAGQVGGMSLEVLAIDFEQRLDARVESATAQAREPECKGEQLHQLERRFLEHPLQVKAQKRRILAKTT